jgi:hypothetical protein
MMSSWVSFGRPLVCPQEVTRVSSGGCSPGGCSPRVVLQGFPLLCSPECHPGESCNVVSGCPPGCPSGCTSSGLVLWCPPGRSPEVLSSLWYCPLGCPPECSPGRTPSPFYLFIKKFIHSVKRNVVTKCSKFDFLINQPHTKYTKNTSILNIYYKH